MGNSAVERINRRVWRIALPLPMRDLKEVNAYAVGGDDGVTLIDPVWIERPRGRWPPAINALARSSSEIPPQVPNPSRVF